MLNKRSTDNVTAHRRKARWVWANELVAQNAVDTPRAIKLDATKWHTGGRFALAHGRYEGEGERIKVCTMKLSSKRGAMK